MKEEITTIEKEDTKVLNPARKEGASKRSTAENMQKLNGVHKRNRLRIIRRRSHRQCDLQHNYNRSARHLRN